MTQKIFLGIFVCILGVCIVGVVYSMYILSLPVSSLKASIRVDIAEGQDLQRIMSDLHSQGIIPNQNIFLLYLIMRGWKGKIMAGMYEIPKLAPSFQIASILTSGHPLPSENIITFVEGWTAVEMAAYLNNQSIEQWAEFLEATKTTDSRTILPNEAYDFFSGKPLTATLEGYLFPDTYRVYPNVKGVEIIKKMLTNFGVKLSIDLRAEIQKQNKTIFEVITLASIVEKEGKTLDDRKKIADVFLKRLAINMPLQSDATVNYATGKNVLQPSHDDVSIESLYNTYKYKGLPPGPICNPSLQSIEAVIYPTQNEFYYFLVTNDGVTIYSKTGEEHIANKQKYLQ